MSRSRLPFHRSTVSNKLLFTFREKEVREKLARTFVIFNIKYCIKSLNELEKYCGRALYK